MSPNTILIAAIAIIVLLIAGFAGYWYLSGDMGLAGTPQTATTGTPSGIAPTTPLAPVEPAPAQEAPVPATSTIEYAPTVKATIAEPEKLPEQKEFRAFSYNPATGRTLTVSGTCADAYYAVLIFDAKTDYRKDPAAARANSAFACPSERAFKKKLRMQDFNLPAGSYYFFTADQGKTGSWYNPR
ncbi:hypothetical protein HYR65_02330 [Candidatus Azambacteria bacterium]|nr:hypothetical protein [Candidatus Azambacteria bacterium]